MKKNSEMRKILKVLPGGKMSVNEIKKRLPGQFEELKIILEQVKKYEWQALDEVKNMVKEYEMKYGKHLEGIYSNEIDRETLDAIYQNINDKLLPRVREARQMKKNEAEKRRKNIGFEIIE